MPFAQPLHAASHPDAAFWRDANSNFLSVCLLDWCKLFADPNAKHGWRKVVSDSATFEKGLLIRVGLTASEFAERVQEVKKLRDKFLAHLDDDRIANIPVLDVVLMSTNFYHEHVLKNEMAPGEMPHTFDKGGVGYQFSHDLATAIYEDIVGYER